MTKDINIWSNLLEKTNVFILGILVFLIPIHHKFLSPIIGIWVLTSIALIFKNKLTFKRQNGLTALIGLYLFLAIGLLWTDNHHAGGFDLEVKLSLLIFPLIFMFLQYSKQSLQFLMRSFIIGIVMGATYLLFHAYQVYQTNNLIDSFVYTNLSKIIHPTYLSYYVVVGLTLLLLDLKYRVLKIFNQDWVSIVFIGILFVFNTLLLSRIGTIVGFLCLLIFIVQLVVTKRKYLLGGSAFLILLSISVLSYKKVPYIKQRVNELVIGLISNEGQQSDGSTGIRFKIWKEGLTLIKSQPIFGYGTGDVKDELMAQYQKNDIKKAYTGKLNAHNQFIQITIALGGVGIIALMLVLYLGISGGIKERNYLIACFLLITICFMLPESILENQAGTIFFGLFVSLLNQKSLRIE